MKTREGILRESRRVRKQISRLYNSTISVREIESLLRDLDIATKNELAGIAAKEAA